MSNKIKTIEEAKEILKITDSTNNLRYPTNIKFEDKETKEHHILNVETKHVYDPEDWYYYERKLDNNRRIFVEEGVLKIYNIKTKLIEFELKTDLKISSFIMENKIVSWGPYNDNDISYEYTLDDFLDNFYIIVRFIEKVTPIDINGSVFQNEYYKREVYKIIRNEKHIELIKHMDLKFDSPSQFLINNYLSKIIQCSNSYIIVYDLIEKNIENIIFADSILMDDDHNFVGKDGKKLKINSEINIETDRKIEQKNKNEFVYIWKNDKYNNINILQKSYKQKNTQTNNGNPEQDYKSELQEKEILLQLDLESFKLYYLLSTIGELHFVGNIAIFKDDNRNLIIKDIFEEHSFILDNTNLPHKDNDFNTKVYPINNKKLLIFFQKIFFVVDIENDIIIKHRILGINEYAEFFYVEPHLLVIPDYTKTEIIEIDKYAKINEKTTINKYVVNNKKHVKYNKYTINSLLESDNILFPSLEEITAMCFLVKYFLIDHISLPEINDLISRYI